MTDLCSFLMTLCFLLALGAAFDTRSKKKQSQWLDAAHTIKRGAQDLSRNTGKLVRTRKKVWYKVL